MYIDQLDPSSATGSNASSEESTPIVRQSVVPLETKAKQAAEKFEAFFIAEIMRQMRRTAKEFGDRDDANHDRPSDDILDLSYSMVADALAGQHAFGVADVILRQVLPGIQQGNRTDKKI